jgi:hypothetical protein
MNSVMVSDPALSAAAGAKVHDISVRRVKYFVMQSGEDGVDPLG